MRVLLEIFNEGITNFNEKVVVEGKVLFEYTLIMVENYSFEDVIIDAHYCNELCEYL